MKTSCKKLIAIALIMSFLLLLASCGPTGSTTPSQNQTNNGQNTPNAPIETPPQKYYTVKFDYADGTGRSREISILEGDTIGAYAPREITSNSMIIGWSTSLNGPDFVGGVYYDLTLYAKWKSYEKKVYEGNIPDSINEEVVEIYPSSYENALQNKTIRIGSNVQMISFIGSGVIYEDFAIQILGRYNNLDISFDNFSYSCSSPCALKG